MPVALCAKNRFALCDPISEDDVRAFLFAHVATYDELALLLCLLRRPESELQPSEVASELGIGVDVCQSALEKFCASRLAARNGNRYKYSPTDEALSQGVVAVDRLYQLSPVVVIRMMSENAVRRVRSTVIRAFPPSRPGKQ